MQGSAQRRSHPIRWFLALVAIVELIMLVAIVLFGRIAQPCLSAAAAQYIGGLTAGPGGGAAMTGALRGGTAPDTTASAAPTGAVPASEQTAAQTNPQSNVTAGAERAAPAAAASGSLNDVPDPKCVAKTAASLLTSGQGAAPPSCPPLQAPAELKDAASQVQHVGETAPAK